MTAPTDDCVGLHIIIIEENFLVFPGRRRLKENKTLQNNRFCKESGCFFSFLAPNPVFQSLTFLGGLSVNYGIACCNIPMKNMRIFA